MNRCDFSSISTCLKNHISESNQMSQPDFLYELFEDFMDDPANQDFSMDNGLVCRWMTGQAKIRSCSPEALYPPLCWIILWTVRFQNHVNLGGLYRMNGHPDLAREHMEKSISLLDQFNLLHINDSIPQIANYAMFLTEQQEPERGISELQKLSGIIKEYHFDDCLDYAKVQETLGTIYLMTANLPQAKTHFKRAFKIYEKIWADEPEMIEAKYQEIQELYPQIGFCIEKNLSGLLTK